MTIKEFKEKEKQSFQVGLMVTSTARILCVLNKAFMTNQSFRGCIVLTQTRTDAKEQRDNAMSSRHNASFFADAVPISFFIIKSYLEK